MKNYFKTGMFVLLGLGLTIACDDDDTTTVDNGGDGGGTTTTITEVSFTTAASGDGTEITVTPTSTGGTAYSVDFGDAAATNDADVMATAGPGVMYDYPNATATYSVSVTASATGAEDVTISQDVTVTYEAPAASDLVGEWVLAHRESAMYLGAAPDKSVYWWGNGIADIDTRACLFDDKYVFNADGTFENQMGDQTWINWEYEGASEGCGAPETPYDGSSSMTYTHDSDNNTLTLMGKGAHLALAKVANDVLVSGPEAGPESLTYTVVAISDDKNEFEVQISYANADGNDGKAYWNFTFARVGSTGAALDQTDSDGDGVIDLLDTCPTEAGTEENGCPAAGDVEDPMDDFEGNGNITWVADGDTQMDTAAANPSKSGANTSDTVLMYNDNNQQYANIRFDLDENKTAKFDLTQKHTFKVMVYVPTPTEAHTEAKTLAVKLQDGSSNEPWNGQHVELQNYEYDVWQELTFDFSAVSTETKYSRIVVQFNGENNYEGVEAYIDNFKYE